jgi:FAD/FMN-containing dehydrogenase
MAKIEILERGTSGYEEARDDVVWNGRTPGRRPDAIVLATGPEDVQAGVRIARERGWRVAVRSGGHNFVGVSLRDDGLLIDLSRMRKLTVDLASRTATAEPGARTEEALEQWRAHGLAFGVGHCPTVGLGGFLLGGGMGFNTGAWGFGAEQVSAVDVVRADGELVRASNEEYPDLFWAARGAGPGFFGVIVRYHLVLQPDPAGLTSHSYTYPLGALEEVVSRLDEVTDQLDPAVEPMGWIGKTHGHDGEPDPESDRVFLLNALAYLDTPERSLEALAPLREGPLEDLAVERTVATASFKDLFDFQRLLYRRARYAVDCIWTDEPPATQPLADLRDQMNAAAGDRTHALWQLPFGNYRGSREDMAAGDLGRYYLALYSAWEHEDEDAENIAWLRRTMQPWEPASTGHYAGDVDLLATGTRSARTLSPAKWARLQELRAVHDPDGVFHHHLETE